MVYMLSAPMSYIYNKVYAAGVDRQVRLLAAVLFVLCMAPMGAAAAPGGSGQPGTSGLPAATGLSRESLTEETSASAPAQVDSLNTYILAAVRNNPALMSLYRNYEAQVASARGAGALNDPELSIGYFPDKMMHVNGKQVATFSLMQMFPWFGTLKAGRQQMEYKAEAAYQKFRQQAIDLAFNLQRQWYAMLAQREKIRSVEAQRRLLTDIRKVAVYQYKSALMGKNARMSDQLRLEAEDKRLEEQEQSLADQLRLQQQQFNLTMHRGADAPVVLPDSLLLRQLPVLNWQQVLADDPGLAEIQAEEKALEAQERRAKSQGMPMIGVGVEYMLNSKVDMPQMANMNGQDMLMPMLKVTLPIYRRKTNMARKSARLLREGAQFSGLRREDELQGRYLGMEQRAEDVVRKVKLYDEETRLLDRTLTLMRDEYVAGSTQLTDLLQTVREQIDYALKKAEAYAEYNTVAAELEQLAAKHDYAKRAEKENH
jgi:cobalt-zinc-cadmium efflux system outer membrane protein